MPSSTISLRCVQCNARLPERADEGVLHMGAVFIRDPRLCPDCASARPARLPVDPTSPAKQPAPVGGHTR